MKTFRKFREDALQEQTIKAPETCPICKSKEHVKPSGPFRECGNCAHVWNPALQPSHNPKKLKEEEEPKMYYHGTSSVHLGKIKAQGLKGSKIYVTPHKHIAAVEAHNTVHGDYGGDKNLQGKNAKSGVGGHPVVLSIHPKHLKNLVRDKEYPEDEPAFHTDQHVPVHGISHIEHYGKNVPNWVHSYWKGDGKHEPTNQDLQGISEDEGGSTLKEADQMSKFRRDAYIKSNPKLHPCAWCGTPKNKVAGRLCGTCARMHNAAKKNGVKCGPKCPCTVSEDESGSMGGPLPTNSAGSANIAGIGIQRKGEPSFAEPGVPVRRKLEVVGPEPVDPRIFADKIFGHSKLADTIGKTGVK